MALKDSLAAPPNQAVRGFPCSTGELLKTLQGDDLRSFERALADFRYTARYIVEAVRADGHLIAEGSLRKHRASRCRCFTERGPAITDVNGDIVGYAP